MKINEIIQREMPSRQDELAHIFAQFPRDAEVTVKRVKKGTFFVEEGRPCCVVYLILDGKAAPQYYSGHNAFVAKDLKRLSIIGDIAVLGNRETYSTSVVALTDCRLLEIRSSDYWRWMLCDSAFLKKQTETAIGILLGELTGKRALEGETAEIRLLNYFVFYCQKERPERDKVITVKKTRDQIAEEVGGISVRTINRKLAIFARDGLITMVRGKVQISMLQLQRMEKRLWNCD